VLWAQHANRVLHGHLQVLMTVVDCLQVTVEFGDKLGELLDTVSSREVPQHQQQRLPGQVALPSTAAQHT
jgi:hypothetical protein